MKPIDPQRIEILDPLVAGILRKKTTAEKFHQMAEAGRTARIILTHTIRQAHPKWNESEISAEVARRILRGSD